MNKKIGDSIVVVTGASSGIGRATALRFARLGATVALVARREEALRRLAEECEGLGGRALAIAADVRDEAAVRAVARQVVERFGRLDIWVNNAAVSLFGRLEETPLPAFRAVIETNLFGYVHGARAVLPLFRDQGYGLLVNVSSVVGRIGQPYTSAYVSTKFAIIGLSECLRMELRDAPGIHVCTVLPGSIDTPLFQHAGNYTGRVVKPMGPVVSAEEVAGAIVGLVERPRREVAVGSAPTALMLMQSLAPLLAEKIIGRQVERNHFAPGTAPETEGNLFTPMRKYETVSGGWLPPRTGGKSIMNKVMVTAALGLGVGLLLTLTPKRAF